MKATPVVLLLAISLLLAGCGQPQGQAQGGTQQGSAQSGVAPGGVDGLAVEKGDAVKAEYVGSHTDGTVFDKSEGRGPLEFVAGAGQMIQGFDEAVIGMKLNEEKTVTIPPEKAYGTADTARKAQVPLEQIQGDGNISIGSDIYSEGTKVGTVTEINGGMATISMMHPLAGKTLKFWIKIVDIKKEA